MLISLGPLHQIMRKNLCYLHVTSVNARCHTDVKSQSNVPLFQHLNSSSNPFFMNAWKPLSVCMKAMQRWYMLIYAHSCSFNHAVSFHASKKQKLWKHVMKHRPLSASNNKLNVGKSPIRSKHCTDTMSTPASLMYCGLGETRQN